MAKASDDRLAKPRGLALVRKVVVEHQFACFVVLCIAVALTMTIVSLYLYRRSGAMNLDMSRPGYERVRTEVEKSSDDQPYDSSGPLNNQAIEDFQGRINKYQDELNDMGNYDNSSITDDSLNLVDPNQSNDQSADQPAGQTGDSEPAS